MKQFLQGIGFIVLVICGFWLGMKWGAITPTGNSRPRPMPVSPRPLPPEEVPTNTVDTTVSVSPETNTPTPPVSPIAVSVGIDNGAKVDLPVPKNDKVNHYENTRFGYGFDVPANVYYSGFGGQGKALHSIGIAKDVPETFVDSAVRVYFYGKTIPPELQTSSRYDDPAGKYVLILLSNQTAVRIEADNITHPVVQKIAQTVAAIQ